MIPRFLPLSCPLSVSPSLSLPLPAFQTATPKPTAQPGPYPKLVKIKSLMLSADRRLYLIVTTLPVATEQYLTTENRLVSLRITMHGTHGSSHRSPRARGSGHSEVPPLPSTTFLSFTIYGRLRPVAFGLLALCERPPHPSLIRCGPPTNRPDNGDSECPGALSSFVANHFACHGTDILSHSLHFVTLSCLSRL